MLTESGNLHSTGQCWGGNDRSEFTKLDFIKGEEKVDKVFTGGVQWVITSTGKVWYCGRSKHYSLPEDSSQSSFKEFKLSSESTFNDKIVYIASSNKANLWVTESGKLWGMGQKMLKPLGMDSEVPV